MRAGSIEGWAFAVQVSTSYVSAVNYLPALSSGSRVLVASCDVNATQRVEYAVDGQVLSPSTPGFPRTTTARTRRSSPGRRAAGA